MDRFASAEQGDILPEEASFHDMDGSWQAFTLCEAFEWKFLPYPGGLLDQPEALLDDLLTWRWLVDTAKNARLKTKEEAHNGGEY